MTPESLYKSLLAIRTQVDALLEQIPKAAEPPPAASAAPTVKPPCSHPQRLREPIGGFGPTSGRWLCQCGATGEGN